jgi:hypothetical protein
MSLQNGKPWMIERSDFIESVNKWYTSPLATINDAILAAFVSLRLAAADILEAFNPQRPSPFVTHAYRFDSLLKTLTPQVEAWKKRWLHIALEKGTSILSTTAIGLLTINRAMPSFFGFILRHASAPSSVLIPSPNFHIVADWCVRGRHGSILDHLYQRHGYAETSFPLLFITSFEFCSRLNTRDDCICRCIPYKGRLNSSFSLPSSVF